MRSKDFNELGDEPIYCETQHDEVIYSGSEDDYYEAPEHRRLRIEAQAVQFLNGNIPYLLSGRLQGPFDTKTWDNPWKSRRAQRLAKKREIQSRHSLTTVEAAREHDSLKATDELPDTQRTSLYPLPSPETTNPPSTRKNAYMGEDDYSRIKSWREAVRSIPVTKDPFWASRQAGMQDGHGTTKRRAEQNWLHRRASKKRKSANMSLPLDNSPSQTAANTRRKQASKYSENVAQSAPGSSTHEFELTTHWNAHSASFDTPQLASLLKKMPFLPRTAQTSQPSEHRRPHGEPECSEDELSLPSATPSRRLTRSCRQKPVSIAGASAQSRRKPVAKRSSASHSICGQAGKRSTEDERLQFLWTLTNNRPGPDRAKSLATNTARRALEASQQDNSFYFHARPKNPAERPDVQHSLDQMNGVMLSLPSAQPRAPARAGDVVDTAVDDLGNQDTSATASFAHQMALGKSPQQEVPLRSTDRRESSHVCTQELSPVSMKGGPRATTEAAAVLETTNLRVIPCMNGAIASDPESSTYFNKQDLSTISEKVSARVEDSQGSKIVSQVPHNQVDSQRTTSANTHKYTIISSGETQMPDKADGIDFVEQSPDHAFNPDRSTFLDTQDQSTTQSEKLEDCGVKIRHDVDVEANKEGNESPAVEHEVESDSERSTYMSASSHIPADRTGDTAHEPVQGKTAASAASSQAGVKWLIDEPAQSTREISCESGLKAMIESIQATPGAFLPREDEDVPETELRPGQDDMKINKIPEDASVSAAQVDNDRRAVTAMGQENSPTDLDGPTASSDPPHILIPLAEERSMVSGPPESGTEAIAASCIMDETKADVESRQSQSPWRSGETFVLRALTAPQNAYAMLGEATAKIELEPIQSPWVKGATNMPMPAVMETEMTLPWNSSKSSVLADEEGFALSNGPQTPWLGDRSHNPIFSLPVKKFSDFMKLSPKKTRASLNGRVLRGPESPRVLFESPVPLKPNRRVTFAPLPGEQKPDLSEAEIRDDELCVEEDVPYFDPEGETTSSIRVPKLMTRPCSPPPLNVGTVDSGELPDHDERFARHFEAMSKRKKKPSRSIPRLLPLDSQQTNGSQGVGAMAEAFIQASQIQKKGTKLIETTVAEHAQKACISTGHLDNQENIEPVDDVSAVLDNLDDFLENTWGAVMSMDNDTEKEAQTQKQTRIASNRFGYTGDPMLTLNTNIWAD